MHRPILFATVLAVALPSALGASAALAATAEGRCQSNRYAAAAKYAQCEQNALAAFYRSGADYEPRIAKCNVKYQAVWTKIQAQASGDLSHCDRPRFQVLGQTVRDYLTGLEWERKTDDGDIHDTDDQYEWSGPHEFFVPADGTAFTTFFATLNGGICFAGHCDWRLPTCAELQTILLAPYPCASDPCIDETLFGPTTSYFYWTATTRADQWDNAWVINFANGLAWYDYKDASYFVRAVRGGM